MEIMINELSLSGQFQNKDEFLDNLEALLPSIKLIEGLGFSILKNYLFFDSEITSNEKLNDITHLKDNRVRSLKSLLLRLSNNPPYWNDSKKHSCENDTYSYNSKNICDTSLAEASQRDKKILSFKHNDYQNKNLTIQKNNINIDIFNINNNKIFLDKLYENGDILPLVFCLFNFKDSNICFEKLDERYGFDKLDENQINEFMNAFNRFSLLSWDDISNSDGLQYKPYSGNWFGRNYQDKNIHKFRITQRYRCFGYREKDTFHVLRFEIDHTISDKG